MKLKLYPFIVIALSCGLVLSCRTASKLYQKGNYDEAVELAAKKLQKDPGDIKLLDIIRSAYQFAVKDHESRIRSNSETTNELKWEWMFNEYTSLQRLYEAIRKVPSVYDLIHPADYSSYLATYGERAGDVRYDRGLRLMQRNDKESYRNAYRQFQVSLQFKPGNRDIGEKLNEAYEYAVTNVVLLPMEQSGYRYSSYNSFETGNFDEKLLRNLEHNNGNEFVRFYSSWEARSKNIRADQVMDMRFTSLDIGRCRDERSTKQVTKEVVVREIVYKPDSIVKEYGRVNAQIATTNGHFRHVLSFL